MVASFTLCNRLMWISVFLVVVSATPNGTAGQVRLEDVTSDGSCDAETTAFSPAGLVMPCEKRCVYLKLCPRPSIGC
jgi:hypothetical protein